MGFAVIARDIGDQIEIEPIERVHAGTFDQVVRMFMVLRPGEEKADVVQHRRGMKNARVLLGQTVQLMELVEKIERQLTDMVRVGGVVEIFLADLIE